MKNSCERFPSFSGAVLVFAIAACASAPEPRASGVLGAKSGDSRRHGEATERSPNDVEVLVHRELERLIAEGGTQVAIVVLDPRDERVLAAKARRSGGNPDADDTNDTNDPVSAIDRIVSTGSTIKALTVAAAIEAGRYPSRRFDSEGGEWSLDTEPW